MKLKYTLAALAATTLASNAAVFFVDNLDLPTPNIGGAQSNYSKQSFTPNVAGIGTSDTVTATAPTGSVFLQGATFLRSPDGGGGTAGQIFIDVYQGIGDGGTFVGSSTNSIDLNATGASTPQTWTFANLELDSTLEYALVFSTDAGAGNSAVARLTAANNGGGFVNTYSGGSADDTANGSSPVPFDSRFQVQLDTTPEPSSTALLGLGGLALILRRRK